MWLEPFAVLVKEYSTLSVPTFRILVCFALTAINIVALLNMLSYIRAHSNFKRSYSIFAYFLDVFAVFNIFRCAFQEVWDIAPITLTEATCQFILFSLIISSRGNVSILIPKRC